MQTATPSQGGAIIIAYYLSVPAQLKFSSVSEVSNVPLLSVWIPNLADTQLNAGILQTARCNQCSSSSGKSPTNIGAEGLAGFVLGKSNTTKQIPRF